MRIPTYTYIYIYIYKYVYIYIYIYTHRITGHSMLQLYLNMGLGIMPRGANGTKTGP